MSSPCVVPVNFPAAIENRPSLARIQYRIGRYSDFRARMFSLLDRSPLLLGWTHRGADDPGIALLEGAAILGDILTFYQELYANEAWMRTAAWPQSIAGLVRLIGYRPAPGLGGVGFVAFQIGGNAQVTVPAGFPFSAKIAGTSAPANFETSKDILAVPRLSEFSLFAPSNIPGIYANQGQFGANAADLAAAGVVIKVNDRLMLVDDTNVSQRQIAVVTSVSTQLDQTVVTIAGCWQGGDLNGTMTAYKLGRTFRAFGYNAPAAQFNLDSSNHLLSTPVSTSLGLTEILHGFPLERRVDDLSAGITMLVDLQVRFHHGMANSFSPMTALSVKSDTDSVGPMQGGITRVEFEKPALHTLLPNLLRFADRRTALCYEVIGRGFRMNAVRQLVAGADTSELDYFGDGASYQSLDGRLLQFVALNPDDTAARVEEAAVAIHRMEIGDPAALAVRRLSVTPALTQFSVADFSLSNPSVAVFGNLAPMTQGKTQPVAVLGNGDARQIFQSFKLPKTPLTWLLDEASTPPRDPELTVLVSQIEWKQVDSLFASGPKDQVYIVREDNSGNSWVQFGDGVNGAVLPSGVGNVTAHYRTGNAVNGWRQSGAKPQANGRVPNLEKLWLYDQITEGTADEDAAHIKKTAPGRVEELGRVVSLSDFEFEALALPGVEKALAAWDTQANVPVLHLTVLLSDDTPAQLGSVQIALRQANVSRGAARFPILVTDAKLEYVMIALTIGLLPGYQSGRVIEAVTAALGVVPSDGASAPAGGLFSVDQRRLGEAEYASRIEGAVQNVEGVAWVETTAIGSLGTANDPSMLAVPSPPPFSPTVSCANNRVLALYAAHFFPSIGDA